MPEPLESVCFDFHIAGIAVAEDHAFFEFVVYLKTRVTDVADRIKARVKIRMTTENIACAIHQ